MIEINGNEMNGNGLQLMEIYMGIGGLEFGSGVTRSPGLVFTLLPRQDWLGQQFMQQTKYLNITKFVGIYLKLT